MNGSPRMHIRTLDGIRGFAILWVILHHFTQIDVEPWLRITKTGVVGVDLFFVLSGFLITRILIDIPASTKNFIAFWGRRALRIFPLYFVALALALTVLPWILGPESAVTKVRDNQVWFWLYGVNYLIANRGWEEVGGFDHFWSLAVEEQFYFIWPLVAFAAAARRLPWVIVGLLALSPVVRYFAIENGASQAALYVSTHLRLDAILAGALLACVETRGWFASTRLQQWARIVFVAGVVWGVAGLVRPGLSYPFAGELHFTLVALWSTAVVWIAIAAGNESRVSRILTSSVLIKAGTYSYSMYVFHVMVRDVLNRLGLWPWMVGPNELVGQAILYVFASILTYAVAVLTWRVIEEPLLRLKRYFPYDPSKPEPLPSTMSDFAPAKVAVD